MLQESPQFSCERRFWFQCQMDRQACSIAPTGSAYSHGLCGRARLALIAAMLFFAHRKQRAQLNFPAGSCSDYLLTMRSTNSSCEKQTLLSAGVSEPLVPPPLQKFFGMRDVFSPTALRLFFWGAP